MSRILMTLALLMGLAACGMNEVDPPQTEAGEANSAVGIDDDLQ